MPLVELVEQVYMHQRVVVEEVHHLVLQGEVVVVLLVLQVEGLDVELHMLQEEGVEVEF